MGVPQYNEFMPAVLKALADGAVHTAAEVNTFCADAFHLTDEERQSTLASGVKMLPSRVSWARTYLKNAGLIIVPKRGTYQLTARGQKALADGAEKVTLDYLAQFEEFKAFLGKSTVKVPAPAAKDTPAPAEPVQSPQETIEGALSQLNSVLAEDLMAEVMNISSYDFEKLIIRLLVKMGYGSMQLNQNAVTKQSGDEGIDGVVIADKFGFDSIYIQAKQWQTDATIGSPEIQKFVGAMAGQGASKGLFITTAKFSKKAAEYAGKNLASKVVLVDGEHLANLMIEYDLGVTTVATYQVKRVDTDFFNEGF